MCRSVLSSCHLVLHRLQTASPRSLPELLASTTTPASPRSRRAPGSWWWPAPHFQLKLTPARCGFSCGVFRWGQCRGAPRSRLKPLPARCGRLHILAHLQAACARASTPWFLRPNRKHLALPCAQARTPDRVLVGSLQADLAAFRIPHGVFVKMHKGTWHAGGWPVLGLGGLHVAAALACSTQLHRFSVGGSSTSPPSSPAQARCSMGMVPLIFTIWSSQTQTVSSSPIAMQANLICLPQSYTLLLASLA